MATRSGLMFEATFNNGMTPAGGRWSQEGNSTPYVTTIGGQSALRVDLNHYDDSNPSRTELVPKGMDSTYFDNGGFDAKIGQTYWYGMKTYIPADFKSDEVPEIITQFHDYPDESMGEAWKSPAVDLTLEPWSDGTQHYMVSVRSDTKQITPSGGGDKTAGKYTSFKTYDLGPVAATAGQWTEWVWKIKWGYDSRGDLELYRNGKLVLDLPNQGNCFNDQLGPYMKLGLYKWDWASSADTGTDSRTVYYDDVRIAAGPDANYDSVAPTQGGSTTAPPAPTPTPTPTPIPTTGNTKIVVNAAGTALNGQYAHFNLLIDGKKVGEATTTGTAKDYTFTTDTTVDTAHKVQVQFDNDAYVNGVDRNLDIFKITINGKAVAPTASTVTYDRGSLDGVNVVAGRSHLNMDGALVVAADKSFFPTTTTPTTGASTVVVNAQGTAAAGVNAHFKVLIDGKQIGQGTVGTTAKDYAFTTSTMLDAAHKVQIQYDNDTVINGVDRNLFVNKVTINGKAVLPTASNVSYDKFALDGKEVIAGQAAMKWNGTLIVNADKSYFPATAVKAAAAADVSDLYHHLVQQSAPQDAIPAAGGLGTALSDHLNHPVDVFHDVTSDHIDTSHLLAA